MPGLVWNRDHGARLNLVEDDRGLTASFTTTDGELYEFWPIPLVDWPDFPLSLISLIHDWSYGAEGRQPDAARWITRLEINASPYLHSFPWEAALLGLLSPPPHLRIVRVSDVRPDVVGIPLTYPLRVLAIAGASSIPVAPMVSDALGSSSSGINGIVQIEEAVLDLVDEFRLDSGWPTAEVIAVPWLAPGPDLLSTAQPDKPGTLGWLTRLTSTWQTRLVILNGYPAESARTLAGALVDRAGPAVLVADPEYLDVDRALYDFVGSVIHDRPFDAPEPHRGLTLFGGAGREELLRVSAIGQRLHDAVVDADGDGPSKVRRGARGSKDLKLRGARPKSGDADNLRNVLARDVAEKWHDLHFDASERGGLIPLGEAVGAARRAADAERPASPYRVLTEGKPRFLNTSLRLPAGNGTTDLIPQDAGPLEMGQPCLLAVDIGPPEAEVFTVGAEALIEELLLWEPGAKGRWVEIGVSGLGFEVLGAPVRELWLPKSYASLPITFTVVPNETPLSSLRVSLYVGQNLVQSVKLSALVGRHPEDRPRLHILEDEVGDRLHARWWVPRLEYSLGDEPTAYADRDLSIAANDHNGTKVITVKGADIFTVTTNNDVPTTVELIRDTLRAIATPPVDGADEQDWMYGFNDSDNSGSIDKVTADLKTLAAKGWDLFAGAFEDQTQRTKIAESLEPDGKSIHVAHMLVEETIPWAATYQQEYSPSITEDPDGNPVEHAACLASIQNDGIQSCGTHQACLLHPDSLQDRKKAGEPSLLPETVACPRHFWGLRHKIELPAQQTDQGGKTTQLNTRVDNAPTPRLAVASHAGLGTAAAHREELADPQLKTEVALDTGNHNRVRNGLKNDDALDIIYFYCHAEGAKGGPTWPPILRFAEAGEGGNVSEGVLKATELTGPEWSHNPIVVLNGCKTAGFSTEALSPFITQFVRGRKASAILGTEITIWDQLAREVGLEFLKSILLGESAGDALLAVRSSLIAKNNLLGLAYTLYGSSDVHLARPALPER